MPEPIVISSGASIALQPTDACIAHGYGLFESIRLKEGRLLLWSAHWQRLIESAEALGFACAGSEASALEAIGRLIATDGLQDAVIKLSLFRQSRGDQLYIYSRPAIQWPESARLNWLPEHPLASTSPLAGHKTHNYMENTYLLGQARANGFDDYLRPASCGSLAETTVSNIFWIQDNSLYTPAKSLGILPGVVRTTILSLATDLGITSREGIYASESLLNADACFLSNAAIGLLPVHSICGGEFDFAFESAAHPLFQQLRDAVRREQERTARRPPTPDAA